MKLRTFLIISAKHAVNAILTNASLMTLLGSWQQVRTLAGWVVIGKVALATVISREAMVWLPRILAWSQSTDNDEKSKATGA